jgi:hypothetical protein
MQQHAACSMQRKAKAKAQGVFSRVFSGVFQISPVKKVLSSFLQYM